jgi:DNA-3-methyladenine glycosylase II
LGYSHIVRKGRILRDEVTRHVTIEAPFSLALSAAPAAWGGAHPPRHAIAGNGIVIAESGHDGIEWTYVEEVGAGQIRMRTSATERDGGAWLDRMFRPHPPDIAWEEPVIAGLAARMPGMRSFTDGSLYLGLVTSIIGQSVSIASAMAAQRRLATSFREGVEICGRRLLPLPDANELADAPVELIRASGVTWRRAEALRSIARIAADGHLPHPGTMPDDELQRALRELPLVGPWTAASALLWGIGAPDAYPSGDVALLRAARLAYDDGAMTMKELDALAERWRPWRGVASRLLWTNLLGPAWGEIDKEPHDATENRGSNPRADGATGLS